MYGCVGVFVCRVRVYVCVRGRAPIGITIVTMQTTERSAGDGKSSPCTNPEAGSMSCSTQGCKPLDALRRDGLQAEREAVVAAAAAAADLNDGEELVQVGGNDLAGRRAVAENYLGAATQDILEDAAVHLVYSRLSLGRGHTSSASAAAVLAVCPSLRPPVSPCHCCMSSSCRVTVVCPRTRTVPVWAGLTDLAAKGAAGETVCSFVGTHMF